MRTGWKEGGEAIRTLDNRGGGEQSPPHHTGFVARFTFIPPKHPSATALNKPQAMLSPLLFQQ